MVNISTSHQLKDNNTFGFNVMAQFWCTFETDNELIEIITYCKTNAIRWFILGGGSNIIFSQDFNGMAIHPISHQINEINNLVVVDAGVAWDDFVAWAVQHNLYGVENLSLIPGSVGASPVQNVGAYGAEACDTIQWVEFLDTNSMKIERISGSDCQFGYRESIFKHSLKDHAVVLRVAFKLSSTASYNIKYEDVELEVERLGGLTLANVRQAIINIRSAKLPDPTITGNAGSFFKNPVVTQETFDKLLVHHPQIPHYTVPNGIKIPAGWLIETAGWKGYRQSDAGVHARQALVLVNYGTASAKDILNLADEITNDITVKFGIKLEKEVNIW